MPGSSLQAFVRRLHRLTGRGQHGTLTDAELLERFIARRDEAAFEVLLWRHGPMVWAACRRCLRREQDAEDAFQAAFLSLAREAPAIRRPAALAGWLQRVAFRIALRLKGKAVRHQARPLTAADEPLAGPAGMGEAPDLRPVLDDEIQRLPEKYRAPFVLCYLEGLTCAEAARRLGCPPGTVVTWLARARRRLRERLTRRGIVAGLLPGVTLLDAATAPAAVPARLVEAAADAGLRLAAGRSLDGVVAPSVLSLAQGASFPMLNALSARGILLGLCTAVALAVAAGPLAVLARGTAAPEGQASTRSAAADRPAPPENRPNQWVGYQPRETKAGPELAVLYDDGRSAVVPCAADAVLLAYLGDHPYGAMTVPLSVDLRDQNRFLLRFDGLAAGKVRKAELLLRLAEGLTLLPTRPFELGVHEVEEAWDEARVTWNHQPRFARQPALSVVVNPQARELHLDVTPLAQRLAGGEAKGQGWLFKVTRPLADARPVADGPPPGFRQPAAAPHDPRWVGFTTRESDAGPELRVEWEEGGPATYPAGADAVLIAYLATCGYGRLTTWLSVDLADTNRILLRFDVPARGKLRRAELILKAVRQPAGLQTIPLPAGPFQVGLHEVLERWDEGTVTWANQPPFAGPPARTFEVNPSAAEWRLDVTDLARRAAQGRGHGWVLKVVKDSGSPEE